MTDRFAFHYAPDGYATSGLRVHPVLCSGFVNDAIDKAFHEEANRDDAWAAADVFISLADNAQEAFGLTPLEAMAASLPCIVSDWNGYRDTVRDGVDGDLIPAMMPDRRMDRIAADAGRRAARRARTVRPADFAARTRVAVQDGLAAHRRGAGLISHNAFK